MQRPAPGETTVVGMAADKRERARHNGTAHVYTANGRHHDRGNQDEDHRTTDHSIHRWLQVLDAGAQPLVWRARQHTYQRCCSVGYAGQVLFAARKHIGNSTVRLRRRVTAQWTGQTAAIFTEHLVLARVGTTVLGCFIRTVVTVDVTITGISFRDAVAVATHKRLVVAGPPARQRVSWHRHIDRSVERSVDIGIVMASDACVQPAVRFLQMIDGNSLLVEVLGLDLDPMRLAHFVLGNNPRYAELFIRGDFAGQVQVVINSPRYFARRDGYYKLLSTFRLGGPVYCTKNNHNCKQVAKTREDIHLYNKRIKAAFGGEMLGWAIALKPSGFPQYGNLRFSFWHPVNTT